jgi:hypothetical protein
VATATPRHQLTPIPGPVNGHLRVPTCNDGSVHCVPTPSQRHRQRPVVREMTAAAVKRMTGAPLSSAELQAQALSAVPCFLHDESVYDRRIDFLFARRQPPTPRRWHQQPSAPGCDPRLAQANRRLVNGIHRGLPVVLLASGDHDRDKFPECISYRKRLVEAV